MKRYAESELDQGVDHIVIDLSKCTGMDSTFMGAMAGIAMKLAKLPNGKMDVANPGDRNRSSLEDLGLDVLMDIDPQNAEWKNQDAELESKLMPCEEASEGIQKAPHVLEAHKKLCEADGRNTEKFGTVLEFLEAEVKAKESTEG